MGRASSALPSSTSVATQSGRKRREAYVPHTCATHRPSALRHVIIGVMPRISRASQQSAAVPERAASDDTPQAAPLPLEGASTSLPASMLTLEQLRSGLGSLLLCAGRPLGLAQRTR